VPTTPRPLRRRRAGALRASVAADDLAGPMTRAQVADQLGLTRERVRQIEAQALHKVLDTLQALGVTRGNLFD
jgi:DNA-directed RNA polymerase sigma subunit (sigma70/sigma32)